MRFRQDFGRTGIDFTHTADVWTSASVDIRTAASASVTEVRNELGVAVDHERGAWTFAGAYRFSRESDYLAHGPSLSAAWEGLARNVRLEGRASLSDDRVGRAGDPGFVRPLRSVALWLGYTQVLGRGTLIQIAAEQRASVGYHASPYRWVGLGGPVTCAGQAPLCVPEVVPGRRIRYAVAARARQSLARWVSLGVDYRYYIDTWRLQSHTLTGNLRFVPRAGVLLDLDYRAYLQGKAWFYQSSYSADPPTGFVTRDRELSPMFDHEVAALARWTHMFPKRRVELGVGLRAAAIVYGYHDFPGLDRVLAGEGTLNLQINIH
ncbi:hypothetical protein DB30_02684 [Enhygromyxa salina]|uniref:DUF3570 domain-containing protein n=1 Tax=Enhygromyxa salina TaxID=215803 RepID=A0A0C2A7D1_9BACT|nr:DUF3570 domain-containing protein [Enhygromyxa salina]KIG19403.1 hypothetical protein DB30_02684 [Enhygromyxa salina]